MILVTVALRLLDTNLSAQGLYTHGGNSYTANNSTEASTFADEEATTLAKFVSLLCLSRQTNFALLRYADKLRAAGIQINTVAVGSTPTCSSTPPPNSWSAITEIHPGNYIFYDVFQSTIGSCSFKDNAGFVVSRVVR